MIINVLEGPEVGFFKRITGWERRGANGNRLQTLSMSRVGTPKLKFDRAGQRRSMKRAKGDNDLKAFTNSGEMDSVGSERESERERAVQMRTIIGFENGGTNLDHLFHFAADQFFVAGALPPDQHL
ncbi:hypothetical protein LXL04_037596 [Taraxacum kok-saghyz]